MEEKRKGVSKDTSEYILHTSDGFSLNVIELDTSLPVKQRKAEKKRREQEREKRVIKKWKRNVGGRGGGIYRATFHLHSHHPLLVLVLSRKQLLFPPLLPGEVAGSS